MFTAVKGSILLSARSRYLVAFGKTSSFKIRCCSIATGSAAHENAPKYSAARCRNLFSRISHIGEGRDIVQALDQWAAEGGRHIAVRYCALLEIFEAASVSLTHFRYFTHKVKYR